MSNSKNLLVIAASNGKNLTLAEKFVAIGKELDIDCEILDLTKINLPIYNPRIHEKEGIPKEIKSINDQLKSIPKWVICAPEYNGSIPPLLTSLIAWLSVQENDFRELFNGRPIAIATHSGGGGMELLISLRMMLSHLGAQVLGRQIASNYKNPAKDESIKDILERLIQMKSLKL